MLALLALLAAAPGGAGDTHNVRAGLQSGAVFTEYSPYSRSEELVRRLLSPLTALRLNRTATHMGRALREQTVDLAEERFAIYVPPNAPPRGYALLVFVPPWSSAAVPPPWIPALDRTGMIFVSADNSGDAANVFDRREPLALLALQNILQRYRVDPSSVYIGGIASGSRVALRLALGYADVFRGVLLSAGSDPIGSDRVPLPPAALFRQFQERTRIVYLTAERDGTNRSEDARSERTLRDWCVFNIATVTEPWQIRDLAPATAFGRALDHLAEEPAVDPEGLAACRAHIDMEMQADLHRAAELLDEGKAAAAGRLLDKIDAHYGGLAAPRSVELAGQ